MKKYLLLFALFLFSTAAINAQTSKSKKPPKTVTKKKLPPRQTGWTAAERQEFQESCIAQVSFSPDSAKNYCSCMLQKIEKIYPTAGASAALTQEKAVELAKECLNVPAKILPWTDKTRKEFIATCQTNAEPQVGKPKAEAYCACMLKTIEKEYPNTADMATMTVEQINKWAMECKQ